MDERYEALIQSEIRGKYNRGEESYVCLTRVHTRKNVTYKINVTIFYCDKCDGVDIEEICDAHDVLGPWLYAHAEDAYTAFKQLEAWLSAVQVYPVPKITH